MTSDSKYDPVLINTSRLTPPNLSANSVCRERLLRKVWNTNRIAARICILSAPAGYGKSTFLVQCEQKLRKMDVNTAWLTLETGEGDREFFCYLGAAFSQLIPKISDKIIDSFTEKTSQFNYKGIISSLIYSASGNSSQKYALFLDDYHKAEAIQVHEAIKFLINNLPDNFYIFIASRERLPINLSRQRLSGDLLLIDCENLSFDYEEAKTLLKEKNNLSVKSDEVVSLQEKTRGWAAALQLASLSLHNATDRRKFFNSFSGNDDSIYEFISSEIMSSLTDDQADFLIKISILNRFCPPLCLAITKNRKYSFRLTDFYESRFFVIDVDGEGDWYQIHPLLRGFLLRQLALSGRDVNCLHKRASVWFEENDLIAEAIHHIICAGEKRRAFDLLKDLGFDLLAQGYLFQFLLLIENLPKELLIESKDLLIQRAWMEVLQGESLRARKIIEQIDGSIKSLDSARRSEIQCIKAHIFGVEDNWEESEKIIEDNFHQAPKEPEYIRSSFSLLLGFSHYYRREYSKALSKAKDVLKADMIPKLINIQSYSVCIAAISYLSSAKLQEGKAYVENKFSEIKNHLKAGSQAPALIEPMLAILSYYLGDLSRAEFLLRKGHDTRWLHVGVDPILFILRVNTRLLYWEKRIEEAFDCLREAQFLAAERGWLRAQACIVHEKVRLLLLLGENRSARAYLQEWKQSLLGIGNASPYTMLQVNECTDAAQARLDLAEGNSIDAEMRLNVLVNQALSCGNLIQAMEYQVLLARAYQLAGRSDRARLALREALSMDVENSVIQVFRDEGHEIVDELIEIQREYMLSGEGMQHQRWLNQIEMITSYRRALPSRFDEGVTEAIDAQSLIGDLTKKELATLLLVAEGKSNIEISEKLYISINTVKSHLKSAYAKLNISRRTQVMHRLRQFGIL